jgi:HKD family nuclease
MNVQLLTPAARGAYLDRVQRDIASAEHFVLITAFATSDGIALLEPAMRTCLNGSMGGVRDSTVADKQKSRSLAENGRGG